MDGTPEHQQENTQTAGSTDLISEVHVQTHKAGNWLDPQVIQDMAFYYPDSATRVPHEAYKTLDPSVFQEAWHQMQLTAALQGQSGGHDMLDPSLDPTLMDWTSGWSSEELNQLFSFDPTWRGGGSGLDDDTSFSDMNENFSPTFPNISDVNKEVPTPAPSSARASSTSELSHNLPTDGDGGDSDSSNENANRAATGPIQSRKPLSHVSSNISEPQTAAAPIGNTHKRKHPADEMDKENGAIGDNNLARSARNRKPAASKEVVTLTETGRGGHSAASWLTYAEGYLCDEALGPEWKDCIDLWLAFEQSDAVPVSSDSTLFQDNVVMYSL